MNITYIFIILVISMFALCAYVNKTVVYSTFHKNDNSKYKNIRIIWWPFILLLISIISLVSSITLFENFNIYDKWQRNLNSVNQLVRKNNFTYYEFDKNIKQWVLDIINSHNCNNLFISNNLYYGHPDLEFNYSHTMSNKVILSNHEYNQLVAAYNNNNKNIMNTIGSTIVHESAHVHQRLHYNDYIKLYDLWGFYHIPGKIENFDHILEYKRQNPDANDDNIVWFDKHNNIYFINCFFSKTNPNTSVTKYAYPIEYKNNTYVYNNRKPILLSNLMEYNDRFGNIYNNYTPNEIYASYIEIYFKECLNNSSTLYNEAYNIFKQNPI